MIKSSGITLVAYHNNSRGAKATLAAIRNSKSLLHRMGVVHISDSFDRDDVFSVDADQRSDTGIDGRMVNFLCSGIDMRYHLEIRQSAISRLVFFYFN